MRQSPKFFLIKDSWELILIDANPGLLCPPLRSLIQEPFASRPWLRILEKSEFSDSVFNEDSFPLHESLNFGIQNSLGKFALITNSDVFISESILQELSFGNLENDAFYLADRLDATLAIDQDFSFLENKITSLNWSLESSANGELHVRHEANFMPFSFLPIRHALDTTSGATYIHGSRLRNWFFEFRKGGLVFWRKSTGPLSILIAKILFLFCIKMKFDFGFAMNLWLSAFGVHTNASGDFILAKTSHLKDLGGFAENQEDFWRRDSDLVIRMIKKGLRQAVFVSPGFVYHLVTKESGRNDPRYQEKRSYADFCRHWFQTLARKSTK